MLLNAVTFHDGKFWRLDGAQLALERALALFIVDWLAFRGLPFTLKKINIDITVYS